MAGYGTVAVLGSGSVKPEDWAHKECVKLGQLLAKLGFSIITGGYSGIMEAPCLGAWSVSGSVRIGVTLSSKPQGNDYLSEIIIADNFYERLGKLMAADAFVVVPGGLGTSLEVLCALYQMKKGLMEKKPIIMLVENNYVLSVTQRFLVAAGCEAEHLKLLTWARTAKEACDILKSP